MLKYKLDLFSRADQSEHPQTEILRRYPAATHVTPESMFDCWTFRVAARIEAPPAHIQEMGADWLPEECCDQADCECNARTAPRAGSR